MKIRPFKTSKLCWGISLCFKAVTGTDTRQLLLQVVAVKQVRTPQGQLQSKREPITSPLPTPMRTAGVLNNYCKAKWLVLTFVPRSRHAMGTGEHS